MISAFNLEKLKSLLKDFYMLSNIRITVFNDQFQELVAYPPQISRVCQIIRTDREAWNNCIRCDRDACRIASARHTPYTYLCHAGLTESITPLYAGSAVIGYLLFGHIFSYPSWEEGWRTIRKLCGSYQIDLKMLETACREKPLISEDYISSSSHIMQAVASYLCLERMAVLRQKDLPVQIDEYLSAHFTEDISADSLCEHFHIGRTYLYEISRQSYGTGIAGHIRELRIAQAKKMLMEHPDMSISEVASRCGFPDYNYFITVFKKTAGMPPRQYRQSAGREYS